MPNGANLNIGADSSSVENSKVDVGNIAGGGQQTVNVSSFAPNRLDSLNEEIRFMHESLTGNPWTGSKGLIKDVSDLKRQLWILILVVGILGALLVYRINGISNQVEQLERQFQEYIYADSQRMDQ